MTRLVVIGIAAVASACRTAAVARPEASLSSQQAVSRFVDSIAAAQHLPGFAVTVRKDGVVLWRHGVGYADVAAASPET